jgi:hypothetical protein
MLNCLGASKYRRLQRRPSLHVSTHRTAAERGCTYLQEYVSSRQWRAGAWWPPQEGVSSLVKEPLVVSVVVQVGSFTTGNPAFAKSHKLSAKANKPSATSLPTDALGTGLTENFFLATALCRAPELEALGTACAESPQWFVGQKK